MEQQDRTLNLKWGEITAEGIKESFYDVLNRTGKERAIKIITNAYGVDQFDAALRQEVLGKGTSYFGKKLPRFIKNADLGIKQSQYTKRYYR